MKYEKKTTKFSYEITDEQAREGAIGEICQELFNEYDITTFRFQKDENMFNIEVDTEAPEPTLVFSISGDDPTVAPNPENTIEEAIPFNPLIDEKCEIETGCEFPQGHGGPHFDPIAALGNPNELTTAEQGGVVDLGDGMQYTSLGASSGAGTQGFENLNPKNNVKQ